ncbi:MAG: SDR family NAD(P)-dependent oxidoreductase [Actinomycetota bacterium]|nr:SDR family NAD(P)-dependent oxidoreductase [Actinomycetota bacterium]
MGEDRRTVLVTGGTRGIGKGIVERLAAHGLDVAFSGRDRSAGQQVEATLVAEGRAAQFIHADLTETGSPAGLVAAAAAALGSLDVLVHNAGIYPEHALGDMTLGDWHSVLDTNLTSAFLLAQAAAPELAKSAAGRIVFISSITGPRTGISGLAHYCASKGGIDGLMRALAVELASQGTTVNGVAPGTILTESLEELYAEPGLMESVTRIIPAGRMGSPDDIAAAVEFLASPDAGFITGQSIIVDGGQTIPEVQGSS